MKTVLFVGVMLAISTIGLTQQPADPPVAGVESVPVTDEMLLNPDRATG